MKLLVAIVLLLSCSGRSVSAIVGEGVDESLDEPSMLSEKEGVGHLRKEDMLSSSGDEVHKSERYLSAESLRLLEGFTSNTTSADKAAICHDWQDDPGDPDLEGGSSGEGRAPERRALYMRYLDFHENLKVAVHRRLCENLYEPKTSKKQKNKYASLWCIPESSEYQNRPKNQRAYNNLPKWKRDGVSLWKDGEGTGSNKQDGVSRCGKGQYVSECRLDRETHENDKKLTATCEFCEEGTFQSLNEPKNNCKNCACGFLADDDQAGCSRCPVGEEGYN